MRLHNDESATPAGAGWLAVAVFLLLAWSYGSVAALYAREHWTSSTLDGAYAHAPLLLALIGWLIWRRRDALRSPATGPVSAKGLLLLALGSVLRIYGGIEGYVVLQGISLIPLVAGIVLVLNGDRAWLALRFPVLMLLFVIPLPNAAIDAITGPLLVMTTDMVVPLLSILDIEVVRNALLLEVSAAGSGHFNQVLIAPECSGIRSLVSLLAVSSLLAGLRGYTARRAVLLLLCVPLLALLGNVARILATISLIVYVDPETAHGFFHSVSGMILYAVSLAGLFLLDLMLCRKDHEVTR